MLYHLHVKDLALIDSQEVEFGPGLNILTGETGAGKSILIDSINLALGQKANKDMIRSGREEGYVELVFGDLTDKQSAFMRTLGIIPEDGQIIIRRRLTKTRSEIKINDQTSTLARLREVTEQLIDIHGQHEHQSLLREGSHLRILDDFMTRETGGLRKEVSDAYRKYTEAEERLAGFTLDEAQRLREIDFLHFETEDIEKAELREGEEETLAAKYRKYQNSKRIYASVGKARDILSESDFRRAVKEVQDAMQFDPALQDISDSLYDLESIADDTLRSLDDYLGDNEFDEEDFRETEERLDYIRGVMAKYGGTVEKTEKALAEKKARLLELSDYDAAKRSAAQAVLDRKQELLRLCRKLTEKRKAGAEVLARRICGEMTEMGFLDVQFAFPFTLLQEPTGGGMDEAHFEVSLNPGEPLRPLAEVASGGELSRIMLSIKTVLADTDEIPTLIFDEIDTGISGRTAERVSDKLKKIAAGHQVILITHLPQIAAKADIHYLIEKHAEAGHTHTEIKVLTEDESVLELARLLAGGRVTEAVLANARELKSLARGNLK